MFSGLTSGRGAEVAAVLIALKETGYRKSGVVTGRDDRKADEETATAAELFFTNTERFRANVAALVATVNLMILDGGGLW